MSPVAQPDGHDAPWLIDNAAPGGAGVIEDVVAGLEDPVRESVGRLVSMGFRFKGILSFVGAAVPGSGVMLLFGLGAMAVP